MSFPLCCFPGDPPGVAKNKREGQEIQSHWHRLRFTERLQGLALTRSKSWHPEGAAFTQGMFFLCYMS